MNERILELARQAGLYNDWNGKLWPTAMSAEECTAAYEKFAELIVRECEQVSLKNSHRDDDMGAIIARQIKQNFGVEG